MSSYYYKGTRRLADALSLDILSDEFISKVLASHPHFTKQDVLSILSCTLHHIRQYLEQSMNVIELGSLFLISRWYKRVYSPKHRRCYHGPSTKIVPKLFFLASTYPIDKFCYELQWKPLVNFSLEGRKRIRFWCRAQEEIIKQRARWEPDFELPKTFEDLCAVISARSLGYLTPEMVAFYLKSLRSRFRLSSYYLYKAPLENPPANLEGFVRAPSAAGREAGGGDGRAAPVDSEQDK
jgi:hypothetical protein